MIFVCGIHGVGKTQYCDMLSKKNKIKAYSASSLILEAGKQNFSQKKVENIELNQNLLIRKINELKSTKIDFILDGHLSLLDNNGRIRQIDEQVIRELGIDLLIVLVDRPCTIQEKIKKRDDISWDEQFIENFQQKEINYAKQLGLRLGIDYKIITLPNTNDISFGNSIILPVKSTYIEKILSGEKKFEFRKTICLKNIDKIYLYATSPVKKIIGEAEVLEKCSMNKHTLWKEVQNEAGITLDFYNQYFKNQTYAITYKLGETVRYKYPLELESFGVNYVPQSYIYVNTVQTIDRL